MKKLAILVISAEFVCQSAIAEVVQLRQGTSEYVVDGTKLVTVTATMYLDMSSIRRDSQAVTATVFTDLSAPVDSEDGKTKILSTSDRRQFDCRNSSVRLVQKAEHTKNMGEGIQILGTRGNGTWYQKDSVGIGNTVFNLVCGANRS